MKTPTTASTNFSNVIGTLVLLLLVVTALATFVYGIQGNFTALGDPYYQDTILAPERAFIPWLCTILAIGLLLILKLTDTMRRRK